MWKKRFHVVLCTQLFRPPAQKLSSQWKTFQTARKRGVRLKWFLHLLTGMCHRSVSFGVESFGTESFLRWYFVVENHAILGFPRLLIVAELLAAVHILLLVMGVVVVHMDSDLCK